MNGFFNQTLFAWCFQCDRLSQKRFLDRVNLEFLSDTSLVFVYFKKSVTFYSVSVIPFPLVSDISCCSLCYLKLLCCMYYLSMIKIFYCHLCQNISTIDAHIISIQNTTSDLYFREAFSQRSYCAYYSCKYT